MIAALTLAVFLSLSTAAPLVAGSFDERSAAVAQTIEMASDMFDAAKKGHLPSLEVINALYARMSLARELYDAALADAAGGKARRAVAELDAAEYLAGLVYQTSKH